jgi:hypothetical protein
MHSPWPVTCAYTPRAQRPFHGADLGGTVEEAGDLEAEDEPVGTQRPGIARGRAEPPERPGTWLLRRAELEAGGLVEDIGSGVVRDGSCEPGQ